MATYRVQLNREFGFSDLKAVTPYLAKLGVSHIYASPIFKASVGSMHGYDIVDPSSISEELGGAEAFDELIKEVKAYGLGWIQDIVPNHEAYSLENRRIVDVLQNGSKGRYGRFFDIDWNHPSPKLNGRVLVPFLAKELAETVKQKEISLAFDGEFKIRYGNLKFPINSKSIQKLQNSENAVEQVNQDPTLLEDLLSEQFFTLAYWREAFREINYRRFFDILDLIGVRVEEPTVFEETHRLALDLTGSGKFEGLRVDHIDGVFDPEKYLQTLHQLAPEAYLVVEKILSDNETLSESWPVQGSTGYDFVNRLNGLFIEQTNEAAMTGVYRRFTGNTQAFGEVLFDCKNAVIESYFQGDVNNLALLLNQTLHDLNINQFEPIKTPDAVAALIACLPVYRTYLNPNNPTDQHGYFGSAIKWAKQRNPQLTNELDAIGYLLEHCRGSSAALKAVMRFQQFTGAIMAKGFEDTAFYRYCPLLSLNEVGGTPSKFGVSGKEFHDFNYARNASWPLTLNASSTHDTKRGEDARARLNVLSEIPQEFEERIKRWREINAKHKTKINQEPAPDGNEEYMIYQTLLGSYPFEDNELPDFTQRAAAYIVKALREAKLHTSWLNPNADYENASNKFINEILSDKNFLADFLLFQKKIAHYGVFNSLSQTLLKITCPGIPDFYQGSELWNLSMVDPDNRRPVDFKKRERFLAEVSRYDPSKVKVLLEDYRSGKAKIYLIFRALQVRRELKSLFEEGAYVPLTVEGAVGHHVFAFMRRRREDYVVVIVPRFLTGLLEKSHVWMVDWKDTVAVLPSDAPPVWKDAFTGFDVNAAFRRLPIKEVLSSFPTALLIGGNQT